MPFLRRCAAHQLYNKLTFKNTQTQMKIGSRSLLFGYSPIKYIIQYFRIAMAKLERVVQVYKSRYAMHLKEFLRFMYEKVEAPIETLRAAEGCILEAKLRITEDEIMGFLHVISAAQQGIAFQGVEPSLLTACTDIKFSRKPKCISHNAIEALTLNPFTVKEPLSLHDWVLEHDVDSGSRSKLQQLSNESFQILSEKQLREEEQYKINLQSSLFQNQSSVELLCEDHLLHFFEGSILHGEKELKRNLIETVESFTGREIQSTKFIYEYSPTAKLNTEVLSNICLLAQTATNRFIAIFAINSKDSIHHQQARIDEEGIVLCLNNKKMMTGKLSKAFRPNTGTFTFDAFGIKLNQREAKPTFDINVKNGSIDVAQSIQNIFGVQSMNSIPIVQNYEYFQIIFK